ncbi:DUF4194 domain-containing protein [Mycolicibacterium sp. YH-1]|uniref:DUF4194 domain-containing protein n=1 Tax=Mycolicibacterium sp. YH-1 TaxID=2908837 RepID=UPI001F4C30C2|nr:DUF4194 domain-containing protein [Mycolicibacterium sp. YH-1]UNB52951.1 DUF4194 domain-containing protein [Mycolicibacterium sp. YH-1]
MTTGVDPRDDEDFTDTDVLGESARPLFNGDGGGLTLPQRIALIKLVKQPYLSAAEHPEQWAILVESLPVITSRLHDLLLDLRIDAASRVAYKVAATLTDDVAAPSLLRKTRWTANQTALLVVLRQRLRLRAIPSDPVFVDLEELVAAMTTLLPAHVDESRPKTITRSALESLGNLGVVKSAPGGDDRYWINPVLESLLPVAKLRQLLDALGKSTPAEAGSRGPDGNHPGADPFQAASHQGVRDE